MTNIKKYSIIAAVLVVIIAIVIAAAAFIGADDTPADTDGTLSTGTETSEAETDPDETETKPWEPIYRTYECFRVYNIEDFDPRKLDGLITFDVSTTDDTFKFVLELTEDVRALKLTQLTWEKDDYVKAEKLAQDITYYATRIDNALIVCADAVDTVPKTGIRVERYVDGKKVNNRFYPIQNGKDGKVELVSIDGLLDPSFYGYQKNKLEAYGEGYVSLTDIVDKLKQDDEYVSGGFTKNVQIKGFSTPVYVFISGYRLRTVWAYLTQHELKFTGDGSALSEDGVDAAIFEYDGAVILTYRCGEIGDSWIITPKGVTEYHVKDGESVTLYLDDDGSLKYTRFALKFKDVSIGDTTPLKLALARDEFIREVGAVNIGDDGAVTLTPEKTYTISDEFDLDAIYAEHRYNSDLAVMYPLCSSVDDVIEQNRELQELWNKGNTENVRYNAVAAVLGRDVDYLVDMTSTGLYNKEDIEAAEERMKEILRDAFATIAFGEYSIEEKIGEDNGRPYLQFDFEIIASESSEYPVGSYTFNIYSYEETNRPDLYIAKRAVSAEITDEYESFFAETMFHRYAFDGYDYGAVHALDMYRIYRRVNNLETAWDLELSLAQFEAIASELYDGEVKLWFGNAFNSREGDDGQRYYKPIGKGGTAEYHDLISRVEYDGRITYEIRYYSDSTKLVGAKMVRLTIERTDSEYGFKIVSIEESKTDGLTIYKMGI